MKVFVVKSPDLAYGYSIWTTYQKAEKELKRANKELKEFIKESLEKTSTDWKGIYKVNKYIIEDYDLDSGDGMLW